MIIAIDGPAGSGKSTVARALAAHLGLTFLDTGAMYRAVTLTVLGRGLDPGDAQACGLVAEELDLGFDREGRILIDGHPGEPRIRGSEVEREVSRVAAHPAVRRAVVPKQRRIATDGTSAGGGVVAEGRDTTTVVFPEADHKFFLIASLSERARRRARQEDPPQPVAEVQAEIERRDHLDSTRAHSPLVLAADAEQIDTEGLSVEQVVQLILGRLGGGA